MTSLYFIQDMAVFVFLYPYYLADINNLYEIKHIKQPHDSFSVNQKPLSALQQKCFLSFHPVSVLETVLGDNWYMNESRAGIQSGKTKSLSAWLLELHVLTQTLF